VYRELEARAREAFAREERERTRLTLTRRADVRYVGQNHELTVDVPDGAFDASLLARVKENFHAAHREMFGYASEDKLLELVTFRVKATLGVERVDVAAGGTLASERNAGAITKRKVFFDEAGAFVECPIYERDSLRPRDTFGGPAIVEQMDATTVVPPDFRARVDEFGNMMLEKM
jgi:N-methylhydantoinase A